VQASRSGWPITGAIRPASPSHNLLHTSPLRLLPLPKPLPNAGAMGAFAKEHQFLAELGLAQCNPGVFACGAWAAQALPSPPPTRNHFHVQNVFGSWIIRRVSVSGMNFHPNLCSGRVRVFSSGFDFGCLETPPLNPPRCHPYFG
jgi:hypothetical protein